MSDWTLHHGDCLEGLHTLADKSVDVTITDPPYEFEAHGKGKRQGKSCDGHRRVVDMAFAFAAIGEEERTTVSYELGRVTRKWALVFCQAEGINAWQHALIAGGMTFRRVVPWVKPDAMPSLHGRWPAQAWEAIVVAGREGVTAPVGGKARYYECTRELAATRAHPTAKPLALMRQILVDWTLPDELVLDPFAGSGSTGIACAQLGRRFLGWELDVEYHAIATRRLNGLEAQPRIEQPGLFDVR